MPRCGPHSTRSCHGASPNRASKSASDALLLELVDLRHMELQAAAPAAEIPVLKPGQIARIRVDGYGERVFEARLERINPNAEQGSRLILLYLSIDNSDAALRGGMFAQGALLIEQAQAALAIPATAVLNDAGLDYVMVIENGVVQRRAVHFGMHAANDNLVEVLDGLDRRRAGAGGGSGLARTRHGGAADVRVAAGLMRMAATSQFTCG